MISETLIVRPSWVMLIVVFIVRAPVLRPVGRVCFVWYASIIAYLFLNVKHFISEF